MKRFEEQLFHKMEETILSDGFLEDYIQRFQTDSPQEKAKLGKVSAVGDSTPQAGNPEDLSTKPRMGSPQWPRDRKP